MIEFITERTANGGKKYLFEKDGRKYFLFASNFDPIDVEDKIAKVIASDGKYFCVYGEFDNPEEMLEHMQKLNMRFTNDVSMQTIYDLDFQSCLHFTGTIYDTGRSFCYRIYDQDLMITIERKLTEGL